MKIINKIKTKGLFYCYRVFVHRFFEKINIFLYYFFCMLPVNNKKILFESEGDFTDNAQALYQYLKQKGLLNKYKVVWLVDDVKGFKSVEKVNATSKKYGSLKVKSSYYLATSKYCFADHNNMYAKIQKRKTQVLVYLCHGFPGYKAPKGGVNTEKSPYDYVICTGEFPKKIASKYLGIEEKKILQLGFSRIDYFFSDLSKIRPIIEERYRFSEFSSVFLWMPTFRQSNSKAISENYIKNETGLPFFNTLQELKRFNKYLNEKNMLFVLKVHHLQANLDIFKTKLSNIIIIHDYDLSKMRIQLYQFIPFSDALITDYSSISVDYLMLNKPIVYILDDFQEYNNSRGLYLPNTLDYMKGYHIYNKEELIKSLEEISSGVDLYKEQRQASIKMFYKDTDGLASKRILDYFEIN